jgi:hypothetical protein
MSTPFNAGWAAQQAAQQSSQAAQRAAFQSSQAALRAAQQANQQQFLLNGQMAAQRAANRYPRRGNRVGGCLGTLMLLAIAVGAVVLLAHNPGILHSIQHQLNATPTH